MSGHAVCDFGADATNGAAVDEAWTHAAAVEGIGRVRIAINCNQAGHVPWELHAGAVRVWRASGVAVDALCSFEYLPGFADHTGQHWPNEPLGTGNYRLTNHYIERFRLQLEAHGPELLAAGADGLIVWNEPQVALTAPGDNCPPGTRRNPDGTTRPDPTLNRSCLAPDVYASLVWQSCHSLEHIGCRRRIAGAISVLPFTGLNDPLPTAAVLDTAFTVHNPYLLGYLGDVYAHLAACGVTPNWTHLALNMEGYWTPQSAQHVHDTLRAFMETHGDHAALSVTEWGVKNAGADPSRVLATGIALEAVFGRGNAAFFSRPGQMPYIDVPSGYSDWGYKSWRQNGTQFVTGPDYPIAVPVRGWLAT